MQFKEFVSIIPFARPKIFVLDLHLLAKPFNPLLGETYEFCDHARGINFYGEQVSHHPPITAGVLETEHFVLLVNHKV